MANTVLAVGMFCVDTIFTVDNYPKEDTKVRAHSRERTIGGNATNISIVLIQLDCKAVVCARTGNCKTSEFAKEELDKHGLESILLVQDGGGIPESTLYRSASTGSRTCICYRGNSTEFSAQEVITNISITDYDWIHLEHRGNGLETVKLARYIKSVSSSQPVSAEVEKIRDGLYDLMSVVDYITVSKEVCKDLGYETLEAALSSLGPKSNRLIITWGDEGAGVWLKSLQEIRMCQATIEKMTCDNLSVNGNILHCRVFPVVQIVDSIGAGDSFSAGFIASMLGSKSEKLLDFGGIQGLEASLVNGCHVAAMKLRQKGLIL